MEEKKINSIDDYILLYTPEIQKILQELRKVIKDSAPESTEKISWGMPTYVLYGNLVHFAVCKSHIGFYPGPSGVDAFMKESSEYKGTKGSIHFPFNKPIPYDLISKVVKFRTAENKKEAEDKLINKKNNYKG